MSMAELVEESLKTDPRFRHLTVMPPIWTEEMIDRIEREVDRLLSSIGFEKFQSWDEIYGDRK